MSAHVLLNLLNELEKRDKMRGLPSILSLFRIELNKFKNTRARMLDSIYHMTLVYTYFIATNYSNGVGSQVLATLVTTLPLHIQINQNM